MACPSAGDSCQNVERLWREASQLMNASPRQMHRRILCHTNAMHGGLWVAVYCVRKDLRTESREGFSVRKSLRTQ